MPDCETTWILDTLTRWLRDPGGVFACPVDLHPGRLGDLLERNRLLPLFQRLPISWPATSGWKPLQARLESAYQRGLLQGLQQLETGRHIMAGLASAGIQSLAVRGPFLAEDIYDDPAVRLSSDIDILVSSKDRRRAWKVCQSLGYRSLEWECPLWPLDHHRIHWRLQREGDPVVCELHWAVEPVYGVMTLDYEAFVKEPSPTRQFLLLCLHAGEHVRERFPVRPAAEAAARQGMLFRWIDVALFMRKYAAQLDWLEIVRHARDRRCGEALALCLAGVRDWFKVSCPDPAPQLIAKWEVAAVTPPSTGVRGRLEAWWERDARRRVGLETSLPDVLYYLWPQGSFFAPALGFPLALKRLWHAAKALGVLLGAGMSFACFAAITAIRLGGKSGVSRTAGGTLGVILLAFCSVRAFAHEFNDDYGDNAAAAQVVPLGSNVNGCIEIDVDQDWFVFRTLPATNDIMVTVTTGTLWNSAVELAAVGGVGALAATDSVSSVSARLSWMHDGPSALYYVRVAGFASFTTGTYTLAVSAFDDKDGDGMADSWEIACFGSTNQPASGAAGDYDHDGVSNVDEFWGGTHPTNAASRLTITGLAMADTNPVVVWAAAEYRTYEVECSTNLMGGGWRYLGTVTNLSNIGTLQYADPAIPPPSLQFYRVRCLY